MDETAQEAATVHGKAQQIAAHAAFTQDVARPLGAILRAIPDDSSLSTQDWNQLRGAWDATLDQTRLVSRQLPSTGGSTFSAATLSSALTTSITLSYSFFSRAAATPPVVELRSVLQRPTLLQEALDALCAFGLNVGHSSSRSPLDLLQEAHAALSQPSGAHTSPASVLLPARESIDHALSLLLRRRPRQEPAKEKVVSIGGQCGLDGLDNAHFARLETDYATLSKRLSESKQAQMGRSEVSALLNDVLQFHKSFLASLDRAKLRP